METLECIKTRRSIRKFLDKQISAESIEKIIEAGKCAPSADNRQPWKFYIIRDKSIKAKLADSEDEYNKQVIPNCDFILVVGINIEISPVCWVEEGALAAQNILLACHDLGLGAVYLSGFNLNRPEDHQEVQKIMGMPENIIPVAMLLIGYPDPSEKIGNKSLKNNNDLIEYR
jgi:nitroreductase